MKIPVVRFFSLASPDLIGKPLSSLKLLPVYQNPNQDPEPPFPVGQASPIAEANVAASGKSSGKFWRYTPLIRKAKVGRTVSQPGGTPSSGSGRSLRDDSINPPGRRSSIYIYRVSNSVFVDCVTNFIQRASLSPQGVLNAVSNFFGHPVFTGVLSAVGTLFTVLSVLVVIYPELIPALRERFIKARPESETAAQYANATKNLNNPVVTISNYPNLKLEMRISNFNATTDIITHDFGEITLVLAPLTGPKNFLLMLMPTCREDWGFLLDKCRIRPLWPTNKGSYRLSYLPPESNESQRVTILESEWNVTDFSKSTKLRISFNLMDMNFNSPEFAFENLSVLYKNMANAEKWQDWIESTLPGDEKKVHEMLPASQLIGIALLANFEEKAKPKSKPDEKPRGWRWPKFMRGKDERPRDPGPLPGDKPRSPSEDQPGPCSGSNPTGTTVRTPAAPVKTPIYVPTLPVPTLVPLPVNLFVTFAQGVFKTFVESGIAEKLPGIIYTITSTVFLKYVIIELAAGPFGVFIPNIILAAVGSQQRPETTPDLGPIDLEPVNLEPVELEPEELEPVNLEPVELEPEELEPVGEVSKVENLPNQQIESPKKTWRRNFLESLKEAFLPTLLQNSISIARAIVEKIILK